MGISKVVYGGKTLIDLTGDTITADKLLSGITAHGKDGEEITGSCTYDSDTGDATATASEILLGKTAYAKGEKLTGTMANNGAVSGEISAKSESYTVPFGYHDGNGTVGISATEQAKIIADNIKKDIEILGVTGTYEGESSGDTSNNVEAYLVDVTNPTVSFKKSVGTIKAYGYAYATTSSGWGGSQTTMYAFDGTKYYKSQAFGSPSSTAITLAVSNGKLTGLPSLNGGILLVVMGLE